MRLAAALAGGYLFHWHSDANGMLLFGADQELAVPHLLATENRVQLPALNPNPAH